MKNFKEIAEDCLAGKLSGRFVCRDGLQISSFTLSRTDNPLYPYKLYRVGKLNEEGLTPNKHSQNNIIQFIPYEEMKKEQITIDIPEGMEAVQEIVDGEIRIKFVKKKLTYQQIYSNLYYDDLEVRLTDVNERSKQFLKKVEVLRKLTNIRNYFGEPDDMSEGWCIAYSKHYNTFTANYINDVDRWFSGILFKEVEHAEQAIKMLGDELKYLFEPW